LLVQKVVAKYPGRVVFSSENFGESKLAEEYGLKGYPAVFVDGVLVAVPRDFGYFGGDEKSGRYAPWRDERSHERFEKDMDRMIGLILNGKKVELAKERAGLGDEKAVQSLPGFSLTGIDGKPLTAAQASGRVVVVEFWASWCPPCRSALGWLGDVQRKYGDNIAVLALAVESPEAEVRKAVSGLSPDLRWAIATPEVARAFGDVVAVPTMFVFDRQGRTSGVWYGAMPDLHQQAERVIDLALKGATSGGR
jgi:thiol-disulfide isomerase/thioredoxin